MKIINIDKNHKSQHKFKNHIYKTVIIYNLKKDKVIQYINRRIQLEPVQRLIVVKESDSQNNSLKIKETGINYWSREQYNLKNNYYSN